MKLDNDFLAEVGLQDMPEERKKAFLEHVQDELEVRVGEKISDGMTLEQVKEFEQVVSNDQEAIKKMVLDMKQDFRQDETYKQILKRHGVSQGNWEILAEYLSVKWIQNNCPNYREIVTEAKERLKNEIMQNREQLLAA